MKNENHSMHDPFGTVVIQTATPAEVAAHLQQCWDCVEIEVALGCQADSALFHRLKRSFGSPNASRSDEGKYFDRNRLRRTCCYETRDPDWEYLLTTYHYGGKDWFSVTQQRGLLVVCHRYQTIHEFSRKTASECFAAELRAKQRCEAFVRQFRQLLELEPPRPAAAQRSPATNLARTSWGNTATSSRVLP